MSDDSPTLAHVFALSEKIELNMVEERVVTFGFSKDTTTTSRGQQSTTQPCSGDGGSCGGQMTPIRFRKDGCTEIVTFIRWSTVGTVLFNMWWCSYSEGLST
jgi:hypothetical protein